MSPPLQTDEIKVPANFGLAIEEVFDDSDEPLNDAKCVKIEEVLSETEEFTDKIDFTKNANKRKSSWRQIPIFIEEINAKTSYLKRWKLQPTIRSFQLLNIECAYYYYKVKLPYNPRRKTSIKIMR